jgi:hypothetical protein
MTVLRARPSDADARGAWIDAALYLGAAVFAVCTAGFAEIPLQRSWGRTALWVYVGGAAIAIAIAAARSTPRLRVELAVGVAIGAAAVPLLVAASERGPGDRGASAQSEVLIVEEAATALVDGRDPYREEYLTGPLAARPPATKTHVPYPPGILVFGLPRAVAGPGPATDARVWFLVGSLAVAGAALRAAHAPPARNLRAFQVLFALPTGAALLATGGHDVPVLAVLLAGIVWLDRGDARAAGVLTGVALAMRQTTLVLLPFLAASVAGRDRRRFLLAAAVPAAALILPFLVWDPPAFVEDVVAFPLGLGRGASAAETPTLGSLVIDALPSGARVPVTIALVVLALAAVLALLVVRPPRTLSGAVTRGGWAFVAAIVLTPAARLGYVVYPVCCFVWAWMLARSGPRADLGPTGVGGAESAPQPGMSSDPLE